jgi:hypothetical protein
MSGFFRRVLKIAKSVYEIRYACPSVRPSVRLQGTTQLPLDGFSWNLILSIFRKSLKTNIHFWSHLSQLFLQWEMFRTKVVEKIKTRILCSIALYENRATYEKIYKNIVKPDRSYMAMLHIRMASWISEATNTHSEYVIRIAFPLQQWLNERASGLLYKYTAHVVRIGDIPEDSDSRKLSRFLQAVKIYFYSSMLCSLREWRHS